MTNLDAGSGANLGTPEAQAAAAQAAAAAAAAKSGGGNTGDWTTQLPPELKAVVEAKGYKQPSDVLTAYVAAEKMIGADKIVAPKDGVFTDPATRAKLGIPEKADGYKVQRPELPAGIPYDEKFEAKMLPVAHALGLTPQQVNGLVKAITDDRLAGLTELASGRVASEQETANALKTEWGKAYDVNLQNAARAARFAGGDELIKALDESGFGNNPHLIRAMSKIGRMLGEDTLKTGQAAGFNLTPDEAKAEYAKLMNTPAYTDKRNPEHAATVSRVKQLFEQAFPG